MSDTPEKKEKEPEEVLGEINRLRQAGGWAIYCERWQRDFDILTATALSPTATDADANNARRTRAKLLEFEPGKMLDSLSATARSAIKEKAIKETLK